MIETLLDIALIIFLFLVSLLILWMTFRIADLLEKEHKIIDGKARKESEDKRGR
jgi:hypothetical protein